MKWVGWSACRCLLGCGRRPIVSGDLTLRRVVVYRNGVGYFEREGHVDDERVAFQMRQRMVGDFLASLAVIERGGSSVRSASFPLEIEDEPGQPIPPPLPLTTGGGGGNRPPAPAAPSSSGLQTVVMALDGREHDLQVGYIAATPV